MVSVAGWEDTKDEDDVFEMQNSFGDVRIRGSMNSVGVWKVEILKPSSNGWLVDEVVGGRYISRQSAVKRAETIRKRFPTKK